MWLNYDEKYAVSDEGQVKIQKTGKILKAKKTGVGYHGYSINGITISAHKMIANRFCPKIDVPGLQVDHINRDKTDNRACNLRWVNQSTNCRNNGASNIMATYYNTFMVRFNKDKKCIYLKTFKTLEDAEAARDAFKLTDAFMS